MPGLAMAAGELPVSIELEGLGDDAIDVGRVRHVLDEVCSWQSRHKVTTSHFVSPLDRVFVRHRSDDADGQPLSA